MRRSAGVGLVMLAGLLVPVAGWIFLAFYASAFLMTCLDRQRAGDFALPAWNQVPLGRGARMVGVGAVYALPGLLLMAVAALAGALVSAAAGGTPSGGQGIVTLAVAVFALAAYALVMVYAIAVQVLWPSIVVRADRLGFAAGLDVAALLRDFRARPGPDLWAATFVFIAGFIGGLGSYLCGVGVVFTLPYGYSAIAGVIRNHELTVAPAVGRAGN